VIAWNPGGCSGTATSVDAVDGLIDITINTVGCGTLKAGDKITTNFTVGKAMSPGTAPGLATADCATPTADLVNSPPGAATYGPATNFCFTQTAGALGASGLGIGNFPVLADFSYTPNSFTPTVTWELSLWRSGAKTVVATDTFTLPSCSISPCSASDSAPVGSSVSSLGALRPGDILQWRVSASTSVSLDTGSTIDTTTFVMYSPVPEFGVQVIFVATLGFLLLTLKRKDLLTRTSH